MSEQNSCVVGIDLGTTNSEVAALSGDRVQVLGVGDNRMLPSCVGLTPAGELLVGRAARNQALLYPERTVRSIKRKMGSDEKVTLGERTFTPQEISALILRTLAATAARELGQPVQRAVITVPAYFSDAQRQATREAGALAGLEVLRILNEPTAASLAYGYQDQRQRCVLVYDLGGGTFDVSIVRIEGEVTEVLASHGNTRLGGDDFDQLLVDLIVGELEAQHKVDLRRDHPVAYSRIWWAAEEAKRRLSQEPYAVIREDSLLGLDGKPVNLQREISREEYERLIGALVESTLESVSRALDDARLLAADLDAILLVGGSTRTPLVARVLEERTRLAPRQDIHPDLCVALGAGVLSSRLAGHQVDRVLVDVSPYSFGPSHLGERGGYPYPHCYRPVIHRQTPLPVTRTERYFTCRPYQKVVEFEIYQGEDEDALRNIRIGGFRIEGLTPTENANEVLCRMTLDLDGILQVAAIEKSTGLSKGITIQGALRKISEEELQAARERLRALDGAGGLDLSEAFAAAGDAPGVADGVLAAAAPAPAAEGATPAPAETETRALVERARTLLPQLHDEDKEEVIDLNESIEAALASGDPAALSARTAELKELLFFIEGRRA
jgi:molecular chaperone DnaK (HSP70)